MLVGVRAFSEGVGGGVVGVRGGCLVDVRLFGFFLFTHLFTHLFFYSFFLSFFNWLS
jgi:hypothetical protein